MTRIEARVEMPWIREDGSRWLPGQWVRLTVDEYRRVRDLDFVSRYFVPAIFVAGERRYRHAVNACGRLVGWASLTVYPVLLAQYDEPPVVNRKPEPTPPLRFPRDPIPLDDLPSPWPVRRDCGCGAKRARTGVPLP